MKPGLFTSNRKSKKLELLYLASKVFWENIWVLVKVELEVVESSSV